jgi:kynurenine 3-monooxygenase
MPFNIAILGAGPAGLTLALALSKRQDDVTFTIFERSASHLEAATYNPDRSYTIDITGHGIKAAKYVNVVDRLNEELIHFKGIYFVSNPMKVFWDGKIPSNGWTGSRGDICRVLLKELEQRNFGSVSTVHFNSNVTSISVTTGCLTVEHHDGPKKRDVLYTFDLIVAADGGGSMARSALQKSVPGFTVSSHELPNHSRMLHLDQNTAALDPGYLHVMGLPPVLLVAGAINGERGRDSPKWFCQVGTVGKRTYSSPDEAKLHLAQACPSLLTYATDSALADFASRECMPTGRSKVCSSFAGGRVVLLGDAAAPFPPVGQGVNAAMEGAITLDQCLGRALAARASPPDPGDPRGAGVRPPLARRGGRHAGHRTGPGPPPALGLDRAGRCLRPRGLQRAAQRQGRGNALLGGAAATEGARRRAPGRRRRGRRGRRLAAPPPQSVRGFETRAEPWDDDHDHHHRMVMIIMIMVIR